MKIAYLINRQNNFRKHSFSATSCCRNIVLNVYMKLCEIVFNERCPFRFCISDCFPGFAASLDFFLCFINYLTFISGVGFSYIWLYASLIDHVLTQCAPAEVNTFNLFAKTCLAHFCLKNLVEEEL